MGANSGKLAPESEIGSKTNSAVPNLSLVSEFLNTRQCSLQLVEPLSAEDCQIQSMPDASPAKWHLAHTSWFFETFILKKSDAGYQEFSPHFDVLFNSYYNAVGQQYNRPDRGLLSRPSLDQILEYRAYIDEAMSEFMQSAACSEHMLDLIEIGIQHEKQHQELLLTDIQHGLYQNPLLPAYTELKPSDHQLSEPELLAPLRWFEFASGLTEVGADNMGYSFDNERPRHKHYLAPY